jgi:hypothetical protein
MFTQICVACQQVSSLPILPNMYTCSCMLVHTHLAGYRGTVLSLEQLTNCDTCPHAKREQGKGNIYTATLSSDSTKYFTVKLSRSQHDNTHIHKFCHLC